MLFRGVSQGRSVSGWIVWRFGFGFGENRFDEWNGWEEIMLGIFFFPKGCQVGVSSGILVLFCSEGEGVSPGFLASSDRFFALVCLSVFFCRLLSSLLSFFLSVSSPLSSPLFSALCDFVKLAQAC